MRQWGKSLQVARTILATSKESLGLAQETIDKLGRLRREWAIESHAKGVLDHLA
jgi:hypothetical protein